MIHLLNFNLSIALIKETSLTFNNEEVYVTLEHKNSSPLLSGDLLQDTKLHEPADQRIGRWSRHIQRRANLIARHRK